MELERNKESKKVINTYYCLGYKNSFDLFMEYVRKFIHSVGTKSYFSFFWSTSYTHDDLLSPQLIDDSFSGNYNYIDYNFLQFYTWIENGDWLHASMVDQFKGLHVFNQIPSLRHHSILFVYKVLSIKCMLRILTLTKLSEIESYDPILFFEGLTNWVHFAFKYRK